MIVAGQATDFAFKYGSQHLAREASARLDQPLAPWAGWLERLERFDPARVVFAHDMALWEPARRTTPVPTVRS